MSDKPLKILAFGHSHMGAVQRAWMRRDRAKNAPFEARFIRLNLEQFQPNFETVDRKRQTAKVLGRRIAHIIRTEAPDVVLCALMGNEASSISMLRHPQPFDFYWAPYGFEMEPGTIAVPFDVMKATLRDLAENNALALWRTIDEAAKGSQTPLVLLLPPPPIENEEHIHRFPGAFHQRVKQFGVSSALFRYKIWMLYCEVLKEVVTSAGTVIVEPPLEALDEGYLGQSYWSEDPTHGNIDYGDLVIEKLLIEIFPLLNKHPAPGTADD